MQDVHLLEKLAHFDRERIPERVVHAKGAGAGGPNYWPNSFRGPGPDPQAREPSFDVSGVAARHPYTHPNNDFVQAEISQEDRVKATAATA